MKEIDSRERERRAAHTIQSFGDMYAYDESLSGGIAHVDSVGDENRQHLSSSQVEILIETGLQTSHGACLL